ncbi:MAG: hypothetical protein JST30_12595 [Armatimonadetes bacterium]|nr:hypothetical protein [Armatimonadota bacterium]
MISLLALAIVGTRLPANVTWVDDEVSAVLDYWKKESPTDEDWRRIASTEGYRRLKERELGMGRLFEDLAFRKYLDTPALKSQAAEYQAALDRLKAMDFEGLERRALDYLPEGAKIEASVIPLIKPSSNSFVWDVAKNPAIMLYLDPSKSRENTEVTIAHELHHIGYGTSCPSQDFSDWVAKKPAAVKTAWTWMGAFGEGFAVLAAAGGPDADPMSTFGPEAESFRKGLREQAQDMRRLEDFFCDVASGAVQSDEATKKAREFYGDMGAWYSVGYVQAVTIEKAFGRTRLVGCYRDPRLLLKTYNEAVEKGKSGLPKWSAKVLAAMGVE